MSDDLQKAVDALDRKLNGLLAIETQRLLSDNPWLAEPRPRNIDQILSDAGLRQAEIAALLGKTPQAVSLAVAKPRR